MGLLDWLFKKQKTEGASAARTAGPWKTSENGNPSFERGNIRVTVFPKDGGWKYCLADIDDQEEPYFSEVYTHEYEAKEEALARLSGASSRHQPQSALRELDRRERWEAYIEERERAIADMRQYLADNPDLGLSALRKPEAKLKSWQGQLEWQIAEYHRNDVAQRLIGMAERQKPIVAQMAEEVGRRIDAKKAARPAPKAPVTESQLTTEQAEKVDQLIGLFTETPVQNAQVLRAREREAADQRIQRMLEEGVSYGQASGAPAFLNQNEEDFRAFLKDVDQNLVWQCQTVSEAFAAYLQSGDIPAPHYPMRVAVLLRKAKDHDRERRFLAAWCKHFPIGNGTTYAKLLERAKAINAIA